MSIHLNVSNSLQTLAELLAVDLKSTDQNPFVKQWVVTQTEGMNSWLKQTIARENGIAANIHFCKPNDIITEIYRKSIRNGKSIVNTEDIRWCIYGLLSNPAFLNSYPSTASYYEGNDIKRIALSDELADLFDQYQIYRHETIQLWNAKLMHGESPDSWQEWLWVNLKLKLGDNYEDRVQMANTLMDALLDPAMQVAVKLNIPSLHLFGLAVITPYYLNIFYTLAKFMDIHLYLVNPCPKEIWMDYKSEQQITKLLRKKNIERAAFDHLLIGNDLLLNWGGIIKESFSLIMENDDFVNVYNDDYAVPIIAPNTLLKKIQFDIYNNANIKDRIKLTTLDVYDGSIMLNAAYTPVREVEILHNYLIELVDKKNEKLSPKDIVVLVSDVSIYAPFIHSVFSNSPYQFPYNIADESYSLGNNLFTAIREILTLEAESFKVESVLKLLESPYIRNRFKIKDEQILRTAARQAGIIFSLEGRIEDDTRYISWAYGLKKIIYGLCMSGEVEIYDGGDHFIPLDTAEGAEGMERVRLVYFIKVLSKKLDERKQSRTITQWAAYLQELVEDMIFEAGEKEDEDFTKLVQFTEHMALLEKDANIEISFEIFRHSFLQRLEVEKKAGSFAKGGITFCSLLPMRSIPFKVVAMLGMDFDKFPRKETALSFSLLQEVKPGDRNVKNNDKHLFLETLMSAQSYLYISYIGANAKDGSKLPSSSLVDELIDYVARGLQTGANGVKIDTDTLRNDWVKLHPLHSFSGAYQADNKLISYLSEGRYKTSIPITIKDKQQKQFTFEIVNINDIARFLQNPPRQYLQKQLNVYYHDQDVLLMDHELFGFDQLTKWGVQDRILSMTQDEIDRYKNSIRKSGKFPLHNFGAASFDIVVDGIADLKKRFEVIRSDMPSNFLDIKFELENTLVNGKIESIYGNNFISVCNSSDNLKYLLKSFVSYIGIIATGREDINFVFIAKGKDDTILPAGKISKQDALSMFAVFLSYYKAGHNTYFNFYPALAQKDMQMINGDFNSFWELYLDAKEDDQSFLFEDDYLNTAVNHGFFDEDKFSIIVENVKSIFNPIKLHFPDFFIAPKKRN